MSVAEADAYCFPACTGLLSLPWNGWALRSPPAKGLALLAGIQRSWCEEGEFRDSMGVGGAVT